MGIRQKLEVMERIQEIATLAGLKGQINEDKMWFQLGFDLEGGRSQLVHVRDTSLDSKHQMVTIFSPCLIVKKGLLAGVSKDMAVELLVANEQTLIARYGIMDFEDSSMIVASYDHLLATLDPPEFEAAVWFVAMAADAYEKKHGADKF